MEEIKMKTQQEYMKELRSLFRKNIISNSSIFDAYSYRDDRCDTYIKNFKDAVQYQIGLKFSNCYHANGIGNNNEYKIFLETIDNDGFLIQKNVAEFYYCHGIYGGCFVRLTDLVTGEKLQVSRAI
jgi:hypothetical protein